MAVSHSVSERWSSALNARRLIILVHHATVGMAFLSGALLQPTGCAVLEV